MNNLGNIQPMIEKRPIHVVVDWREDVPALIVSDNPIETEFIAPDPHEYKDVEAGKAVCLYADLWEIPWQTMVYFRVPYKGQEIIKLRDFLDDWFKDHPEDKFELEEYEDDGEAEWKEDEEDEEEDDLESQEDYDDAQWDEEG